MPAALKHARIVVTRPAAGPDSLSEALRAAGAAVLEFPALTLTATPEAAPAGPFDWIVFTSPAAVDFGWARVSERLPARLAAPGTGTAERLREAGAPAVVAPHEGAGMQALLAEPAFAEALAGRAVLMVGGHPFNRRGIDQLRARGARPTGFGAYERHPVGDAEPLAGWLRAGRADAIMVSSVAAVEALAALALDWGALAWIVSSERVAAAVAARGARVGAVAASAETPALVAAAREWWSGTAPPWREAGEAT